jgi:S1-C subfamily serine protease
MVFVRDSARVLRVGVSTASDGEKVVVTEVAPDGAAAAAGVLPGDELVRLGDLQVKDQNFGEEFRARYASAADGTTIPLVVRRDNAERALTLAIRRVTETESHLVFDRQASPKAARIRAGILRGTTVP